MGTFYGCLPTTTGTGMLAMEQSELNEEAAEQILSPTKPIPLPYLDQNPRGVKRAKSGKGGKMMRTEASKDVSEAVLMIQDEDEEDDRTSGDMEDKVDCDPDRLKAFNAFVRLYVDENLDRMLPISRQPKDKIQAIMDSCSRQFPELGERSRKRIRTYLKSCRRTKKVKPAAAYHLNSAAAEKILAEACKNESKQVLPSNSQKPLVPTKSKTCIETIETSSAATSPSSSNTTQSASRSDRSESGEQPRSTATSLVQQTLSPTDSVLMKQLIVGYRDSAAFLYRAAEELEQLLLKQPRSQ